MSSPTVVEMGDGWSVDRVEWVVAAAIGLPTGLFTAVTTHSTRSRWAGRASGPGVTPFGDEIGIPSGQGNLRGRRTRLPGVEVFDDLQAELDRLEAILDGLDDAAWAASSGAAGWTVADVVLHLAQTEEAVAATIAGAGCRPADGATAAVAGEPVEETMDRWVREERAAASAAVFPRWRAARRAALDALRRADPDRPLAWAAAPLRPRVLATTRLAEHWAHGLDVTVPLAIPFPDTARLRHVAWLAHRTLPYAFDLAGEAPHQVFCELAAPDGSTWRYGPPEAESVVAGPAGAFCLVGARRLEPEESGLATRGPYADLALRVLRNFAA
jgi:uncharacterized protein (TIGR03084 family)